MTTRDDAPPKSRRCKNLTDDAVSVRPPSRDLNERPRRFAEVFLDHKENISDKWEQYLAVYEIELHRFVVSGAAVRLLEIGVQNGGSLQVWSRYLPAGSSILGIDVDSRCADIPFAPNIRVVIANAADRSNLDQVLGAERFDIIIDDGSHRSEEVIATFCACFPRLEPGGLYVVEDLHVSYWASYDGGLRKQGTATEWFKSLVDAVNSDHIEADSASVSAEEIAQMRAFNRDIARITFRDSIMVVEKLGATKTAPYRRVMTGQDGPVMDWVPILPKLAPRELGSLVLSPAAGAAFVPRLVEAITSAHEKLQTTATELVSVSGDLAAHRGMLAGAQSRVVELETALAQRSAEVIQIEARLAQRSAEVVQLETTLAQGSAERTYVETELAKRSAELVQLKTEVREQLVQIEAAAARAEEWQHAIDAANEKLAAGEQALSTTREQLSQTEARLNERFGEIATLTRLLREKEDAARRTADEAEWMRKVAAALIGDSRRGRLVWLLPGPLAQMLRNVQLKRRGLFDAEAYLRAHPDVARSGVDPLRHYLIHGIREGRR